MDTQNENQKAKTENRWDSDENGEIVAGPEAHARERKGADPNVQTGKPGENPPEKH